VALAFTDHITGHPVFDGRLENAPSNTGMIGHLGNALNGVWRLCGNTRKNLLPYPIAPEADVVI